MSEQTVESHFEGEIINYEKDVQGEGPLENIRKNALEEKLQEKPDEQDQSKAEHSVFYAKSGNFKFYNEAQNLKFSKPICTVLKVTCKQAHTFSRRCSSTSPLPTTC